MMFVLFFLFQYYNTLRANNDFSAKPVFIVEAKQSKEKIIPKPSFTARYKSRKFVIARDRTNEKYD